MPPYSRDGFDPPAPVALVEVRNRATGQSVANVPMLIDTGADVTLVPQAVLDRLQLTPAGETLYELTGIGGERLVVNAVQLDVIFCRKTFRGQYLPVEQPWGILGRNVLNAIELRLNGPQLTWDEDKAFT
jgi:predicted aspartyl protease